MPNLYICLTADALEKEPTCPVTVVVDIFRASSTIVTALAHGASAVVPIGELTEWENLEGESDVLLAGEREGKKLPQADFDNSPLSFQGDSIVNKRIALTTTNGTRAIRAIQETETILVGSFLNFSTIVQTIRHQEKDTLLVCAGWKGQPSLEDTYWSGALLNALLPGYQPANDGALMAQAVHHAHSGHMVSFLKNGSHYKRLAELGKQQDIQYCLSLDRHPIVPLMNGYQIILR